MTNETERMKRARQYFLAGYNCCQSVVLAFADLLNLEEKTLLRLSSSFGGGVARMREVCGAVSGMAIVVGLLYGYDNPDDRQAKIEHYALVQLLAKEFAKKNGSIVCRQLLQGVATTSGPTPEERTPEFYAKRPCPQYIAQCVGIVEEYVNIRRN